MWWLSASYSNLPCRPRWRTWRRSASVTQVLSSWTRALTDGPALPPTRFLETGVGRAGERLIPVGKRCGPVLRRAGGAIATDILRQDSGAVHPGQAHRAHY